MMTPAAHPTLAAPAIRALAIAPVALATLTFATPAEDLFMGTGLSVRIR